MGSVPEKKKDNSRLSQGSSEERTVTGKTFAIAKVRNTTHISLSKNENAFLTSLRDSKGQAAFVPNVPKDSNEVDIFFTSLLCLLYIQIGFLFTATWWLLKVPSSNVSKYAYGAREREEGLSWELWDVSGIPLIGLVSEAQHPSFYPTCISCPTCVTGTQAPRMMDIPPFCSCTS